MEEWVIEDCRETWHRWAGISVYKCPVCLLRELAKVHRWGAQEDIVEDACPLATADGWGNLHYRLEAYLD